MSLLRKLLLAIMFVLPTASQAAVPYIFATQPAGNVPASYLDSDFAYVLTPPYTPPGGAATTINAYLNLGFLHLSNYAAGTGGDDTAGVQVWLNTLNATPGLVGWVDPAPSGAYNLSSQESVSGSAQSLSIMGPGYYNNAAFVMNSLTQNGFVINAQNITLEGFGIRSVGNATAGNAIQITGSINNTVNGRIDNVVVASGWDGLVMTGFGTRSTISNSQFGANDVSVKWTSPGDSTFTNNFVTGLTTGTGSTGLNVLGDPGGLRVINNKFNHPTSFGVPIYVTASIPDGDLFFIGNSIESFTSDGMIVNQSGGTSFSNVIIQGNEFAGTGAIGINIQGASGHVMSNVQITGNAITTTTQQAVNLIYVNHFSVANNYASTGITVASTSTNGSVSQNAIAAGGTISNSSTSTFVLNNPGYNPVGASALSPGASPWTYTAGGSPETIYLSASTSITTLTDNGTSILPHATGANVPLTVDLGPFEAAVIGYTGSLTGNTMVH